MLYRCFFIFYFVSLCLCQGQTINFSGKILDDNNQNLSSVTLIFKEVNNIESVKYIITDINGLFKIKLSPSSAYSLELSHIGYKTLISKINTGEIDFSKTFSLNKNLEDLSEITINYRYKSIEKKNDTIVYNTDAYRNGNERYLKNVLEKLPGLKIKENQIFVNGKLINKLLVDGELFFGGSSSIALDNIPARVFKNIQVISNYQENPLEKDLKPKDDIALNIELKEEYKSFNFGDIEVGLDPNGFYNLGITYFKFKKNRKFNVINDFNNYGKAVLTTQDLLRFTGASAGSLLNNNPVKNDLLPLLLNNQDNLTTRNNFIGVNSGWELNNFFKIDTYLLLASNENTSLNQIINEFATDQVSLIESRNTNASRDVESLTGNILISYKPEKKI